MFETMNKLMLAGLGAMSMSKEKAEKIFDEYVRRGQAEKADQQGFVSDVMETAQKVRKDLEELVNKQVREAIAKLNLASREDVARLEAKLDALLARGTKG